MDTADEALQLSRAAPDGIGPAGDTPPRAQGWPRGCLVRVRGRRWHVQEGRAFADCHLLELTGTGRGDRGRRAALLYPFDRPQPVESSGRLRRVTWQQWISAFRLLVAGATPHARLRTACSARIDLLPYQIEPSLAFLNGITRRVLLADEVGLGKTIQAGLVVSEVHAREPAPRTLILTPAGLRDQWAAELRDRFAIDATVVDAAMLRRTLAGLAAGTNPWATWPVIVASLDFVKRADVLRALDDFTWDVFVVDEAHQCAIAPERSAAVRQLATRSRQVLLLTATPHAGDDAAFERLCDIGRVDRAESIVMFRRSRSDVGIDSNRRVHLLRVRCTEDERRMHRLLDRYTKAVWNSPQAMSDARLAMIVLRKRALSSATALTQSLERRMEALFDVPPPSTQLALPFAGGAEPDEDSPEDDEPMGCLAAPGMEGGRERAWLGRVLDASRRAAKRESKLHRLSRLLGGIRQPAIVFTEYRDTARWLAAALQAGGSVTVLHGGLSRAERQDAERRFRTGRADVLVATDAAGQGLNLHHRCRLVVNLELPWNPMRLEQRIGRVDRIGQLRRPHAIHLVARDTAEEQIVRRLVLRQQRARRRIGEMGDALGTTRDEEVVAAVMGDSPMRLTGDVSERDFSGPCGTPSLQKGGETAFKTIDFRALATEEVARLSQGRGLLSARERASGRTATRPGPKLGNPASAMSLRSACVEQEPLSRCLAAFPPRRARRSDLLPGLLCVFVVRALDADESVVDESLVPLHVAATPAFDFTAAAVRALAVSSELEKRALMVALPHARDTAEQHRRITTTALEREKAIGTMERRPPPLQPGMFDRRALAEAERDAAGHAARELERAERLSALATRISGSLAWRAELALVLVIHRSRSSDPRSPIPDP